jgi:hypothetical protein
MVENGKMVLASRSAYRALREGKLARGLYRQHSISSQPSPPVRLADRWERLGWAAIALHANRSTLCLGSISIAGSLPSVLVGRLGAHIRAHDPAVPDHFGVSRRSRLTITAALAVRSTLETLGAGCVNLYSITIGSSQRQRRHSTRLRSCQPS